MITDFFISIFKGLVNLLPSSPVDFSQFSFTGLYSAFEVANYYLPVQELFVVVGIYFSYFTFRFAFKLIKWIASRVVI